MNIQELEWVKRENLPVKMLVMNNEALGMIRHLQRDYFRLSLRRNYRRLRLCILRFFERWLSSIRNPFLPYAV